MKNWRKKMKGKHTIQNVRKKYLNNLYKLTAKAAIEILLLLNKSSVTQQTQGWSYACRTRPRIEATWKGKKEGHSLMDCI